MVDDHIMGLYHYGSGVLGGLRPASDLDVFVVVDESLEDEQRNALIRGLAEVSGSPGHAGSGRPVEVTVARRASLVPWPEAPLREFQYGEWLWAEFEAGHLSPQVVDHDLAPLIAAVLTASVPIVGPDADELLVPVPLYRHGSADGSYDPDEVAAVATDLANRIARLRGTAPDAQTSLTRSP